MTESQFNLIYRVVIQGESLSMFNDQRIIKARIKREWITPEYQVTQKGIIAAIDVVKDYYIPGDSMVEALRALDFYAEGTDIQYTFTKGAWVKND